MKKELGDRFSLDRVNLAELSNIKKQFESLTCIKGEDAHIADFPFSGKAVSVPLPFTPLSDSEDSKSYCMQVYPSVFLVRRKEKNISGASGEIALYFHVSTDYLLLGRELDRASVRASLLELSAQMTAHSFGTLKKSDASYPVSLLYRY